MVYVIKSIVLMCSPVAESTANALPCAAEQNKLTTQEAAGRQNLHKTGRWNNQYRLVATYECRCTQRGGIRDPDFLKEHSISSKKPLVSIRKNHVWIVLQRKNWTYPLVTEWRNGVYLKVGTVGPQVTVKFRKFHMKLKRTVYPIGSR